MDNITLDRVNYTIKTSWEEISINEYFEIRELLSSNILTDEQKYAGILGYCLSLPMEKVEELPLQHFIKLLGYIKFIEKQPDSITIPSEITIENKLFKIDLNPKNFSTEKYLNVITYLKNESEKDKMINIVSTLISPAVIVKKFYKDELVERSTDEYNFEEHSEFIKNNISIVLGNSIVVFFYRLLNYLTISSITSLTKQITKVKMRLKWKKKLKILKDKELLGLDALIELQKKLEEIGLTYTKFQQ